MSLCRSQTRFLKVFYPRVARLLFPKPATLCTSAADSTTQQHHEHSHQESDGDDVRERLFQAALGFVHQHGWTRQAIVAAAEAEGLPSVTHGLFPRGGPDLVNHFYVRCNDDLEDKLAAEVNAKSEGDKKPRVSMFIRNAVQDRLSMVAPYRDSWPQAMAIMALPQNAPTAWCNLNDLVDTIWHYAGDQSVDTNWYTKRITLAAVYKSTELYMLQDNSDELMDTWLFLERRLDNLRRFGKTVQKVKGAEGSSSDVLYSASVWVQNVLGMNNRNR